MMFSARVVRPLDDAKHRFIILVSRFSIELSLTFYVTEIIPMEAK